MSFSYLIADTSISIDLPDIPTGLEKFVVENGRNLSQVEVSFNLILLREEYVQIKHMVQWYHNQDNFLCISIVDEQLKMVIGDMVFSSDYKSASVRHVNLDNINDINYIDKFIFYFFQVNLLFISGLILHAAAINWKDQAILFSAQSETGKSTQARLWCEHEGAEIVNGDRPAITIRNDGVYAHGTPWTGSDPVINNICKPIKAIVMLEQSPENEVVRLSPEEAVNLLLPRVFMPYFDEQLTVRALDIVNQIIQKVPIYKLKCRPDIGAVEVLKKELSLLPE